MFLVFTQKPERAIVTGLVKTLAIVRLSSSSTTASVYSECVSGMNAARRVAVTSWSERNRLPPRQAAKEPAQARTAEPVVDAAVCLRRLVAVRREVSLRLA